MKSNDRQVAGSHYKEMGMNPWDYIYIQGLDFFEGNIVKYITRYSSLKNINDLKKVQHYVEKLLELKGESNDHHRGGSKESCNGC